MALTTPEVIESLKRRHSHRQGKWASVVEFMLIDFMAVGCQASSKYAVHGYEVKVSRSDWLKELKSPDKAEAGMSRCDFWYLAAPKGILNPGELPEKWGYVEVSEHSTRLVHRPKRLRAAPERGVHIGPNGAMLASPEWSTREMFAQLARRLAYEQADSEAFRGRLSEEDVVAALDESALLTNRVTSQQRQSMKEYNTRVAEDRKNYKAHRSHVADGIEYAPDCPVGWCAHVAAERPDLLG